jgi:hypothetical protein
VQCREVEGVSYLVSDFSLRCGLSDAEWTRYLPLAVVALLIYPIGIPLALFGVLWTHRTRLEEPAVLLRFDIIYEAYTLQFWWFGALLPLTRCALLFLRISVSTDCALGDACAVCSVARCSAVLRPPLLCTPPPLLCAPLLCTVRCVQR